MVIYIYRVVEPYRSARCIDHGKIAFFRRVSHRIELHELEIRLHKRSRVHAKASLVDFAVLEKERKKKTTFFGHAAGPFTGSRCDRDETNQ